jgi:hypothetical protein
VVCDRYSNADLRLHCPDYGYDTCGDADPSPTNEVWTCIH